MNKIREELQNELKKIRKLKPIVAKSLKKVPEGSLVVSQSHGITQFFQKTEKKQRKGRYIKKNEKDLIRALAQKDYDLAMYHELEKQERDIEKVLHYLPKQDLSEVFKNLIEVRKELVTPYIVPDEEYVRAWLAVEYEGNRFHEENKKFKTERGEYVRSKSEKIIADKLYLMGVPYRYEYPVRIDKRGIIYPDFTILKVSSRKEVYLEHLGMMDVPEYCEKALLRIQELAHHGIVLGSNLFVTFESADVPLDVKVLDIFKTFVE